MVGRNIFVILLATPCRVQGQFFGDLIGLHVGCFLDNKETRDLEFQVPGQPNTNQLCIQECKKNFYMYAGKYIYDAGKYICICTQVNIYMYAGKYIYDASK